MKKILLTKCWAILCCMLLSSNVYAQYPNDQVITREGLQYILHDNYGTGKGKTATLTGVESSVKPEITEVVIPATVSLFLKPDSTEVVYKVTEIKGASFSLCNKLTSVIMSEGIEKIESGAFFECKALTNITIPTSVTIIEQDAFYGTGWYENFPDGLVYINSMAYTYKGEMPKNTALNIKEGTISIAPSAFGGRENLTSVSLPASLKRIEGWAFDMCENLSEITLPQNLEVIGEAAFNQTSLKTLTIPASVTHIGASAFNQTQLKTLTIPASVTYMGIGLDPETLRFEGIIPPATTPWNYMLPFYTDRTFYVPYQSFAAYCNTKIIPLGTDTIEGYPMSVKALEDSKNIYAVNAVIGHSDGLEESGGKVLINGEENLTGIKEGEKIEIKVLALEEIAYIDSIQINDEKPIKLEKQTSYTYNIESAAPKHYTIKVNFRYIPFSIADQTIDSIKIYPQNGTVIIENINKSVPVTILNLAGQTLYQGTTDNYAPVSLPSGIYLVKVGTQTYKIVMK